MGYKNISARIAAVEASIAAGHGESQVEEILVLACSGESNVREWALNTVADICEHSDSKLILAATKLIARSQVLDVEPMNRSAALEIIDWIGDRSDRLRILVGLEDSDWVSRASAIEAAVSRLGIRALPHVRQMLIDRHESVRAYACMGLYDLIGQEARGEAAAVLPKQRREYSRIHVLGVLARCGDKVALADLKSFAKSPLAGVRDTASRTLAKQK